MTGLTAENVFQTVKNAQDAGILQLFPGLQAKMGPGERFFESLQRDLLDGLSLEQLDKSLYYLAPAFEFLADPAHWTPAEFTAEEIFQAVKNLQTMGVFEIRKGNGLHLPGPGDRFFEYYQEKLVHEIGLENLDRLLYVMGQGIRFLASEEAMENVKEGES